MSDSQNLPEAIKNQTMDYVTSGAKAALGAVPFAGSLLAEIAGSIIPRQRVDRLADFAAKLEERIRTLQQEMKKAIRNDEEFTDLVEEALRQASRATTEERRAYLASLVSNSLAPDAIQHAESKHLMRLLGDLNDLEVLWLRFYHEPSIGGDKEFRELHEEVFKSRHAPCGCSTKEMDDHALQESYLDHLVRLGLVTRIISRGSGPGRMPEFDIATGDFKVSYHEASPLGRLLLRSIGLISEMRDGDEDAAQNGGSAGPLRASAI